MATFDNQLFWLKDIPADIIKQEFTKNFTDKNVIYVKKDLNNYNNPIIKIGLTDKIDQWSTTPSEILYFNAYGLVTPTKIGDITYSTNLSSKYQQFWIKLISHLNKNANTNGKSYIEAFKEYYTTQLQLQTQKNKKLCDDKIKDLIAKKNSIDLYNLTQLKKLSAITEEETKE